MAKQTTELTEILADPIAHFARPGDVITATDLSHEQKLQVLERWEADARELMVAAEEGMTGGEPSRLAEVHDALRQLGVEPHGNDSSGTKHNYQRDG